MSSSFLFLFLFYNNMMKGSPFFLSLIFLSIILCLNLVDSLPEEPHDSMRLKLIHRHAPQFNARPKTKLESTIELLHNDNIRQKMISHKVGLSQRPGRKAWEMSTSNNDAIMPMYSGRDYIPGQYFALLKVGTPFQRFKVIVDTGSDLTWLNCNQTYQYHRRIFHGNLSSSFKPIPCDSPMCKVDLKELKANSSDCPTPLTPCAYGNFRYEDGSTATGFFFNEAVTLSLTNGRKAKVDNVILGCNLKDQNFERTDGLMGLGYSKTFTLKITERFGGKFTYCLVDHWSSKNVSSYLTFGGNNNKQSLISNMSYTKLDLGLFGPYYVVNVVDISIGGVMLEIPNEGWKRSDSDVGNVILDSGCYSTWLAPSAYKVVTATLMKSLLNFKRVTVKGVDLEFCFNSTGFNESLVPRLAFHFADGARFEPHVKGYITSVEEYDAGVKCLAFIQKDYNIIGNLMQQNFLWEHDLLGHKVGFAASTCA